jgi:hypothetical protein
LGRQSGRLPADCEDQLARYCTSRRLTIPAGLCLAALVAVTVAAKAQGQANGNSNGNVRLDARYTATLAGIKLGEGSWLVDVTEDKFSATASGATSGFARMFSSGKGSTAARGAIKNGQLVPASYMVSMKWGKRSEDLQMKLADGAIKEVSIEPPAILHPDRVPVTDAHRRNVLDPMSGSLLRVQGNGNLMAPETCKQHAGIFDGRMRYDLTLAFKRIEQVKVPGYAGPALVCAIYFAPLAGHVPDRAAIKYLVNQRDMETWLVPIAGTRVLVPVRVIIPTPVGQGVLQATQLSMQPLPGRATMKMQ